jgi:hypothetical protein
MELINTTAAEEDAHVSDSEILIPRPSLSTMQQRKRQQNDQSLYVRSPASRVMGSILSYQEDPFDVWVNCRQVSAMLRN